MPRNSGHSRAPSSAAMREENPNDDTELTLSVARRYYWDDESKVHIGQQLGISRFQVARILQEARRSGLVRIEIGSPGHIDEERSKQVADRLGIERALVVESDPSSTQLTFDLVGTALAAELETQVTAGQTVGVAWSRAAPAMARALENLERCTVVQLSGAIYPPSGLPGSVEVTRDIAAACDGTAHILYAPLVVPDSETATGLRRQPEIAATLSQANDLDLAVLSVGAWVPGSSAVYDLLNDDELQNLPPTDIRGEVSGRLFNADGRAVPNPLDDRVVGASLDQLRSARTIVTTGVGAERRDATVAVARAGLIHTVIIDIDLAEALLADNT